MHFEAESGDSDFTQGLSPWRFPRTSAHTDLRDLTSPLSHSLSFQLSRFEKYEKYPSKESQRFLDIFSKAKGGGKRLRL